MSLARAWVAYWFRPAPLFDLALLRLVAVGFQLYQLSKVRPRGVFGALAALPADLYYPLAALRLMTLPLGWSYRPSEDLLVTAYWATLAAGLLAFVGLWTNLALLALAAGSAFLQAYRYSFGEIHHPEAIVVIAIGLLALAPSGGALSVDDLRARTRAALAARRFLPFDPLAATSRFARWPLLLVGWVFALVYLSAAVSKLKGNGLDWMNGWTLQYYMVQDGLRWGSPLGVWLGQHHGVALLLSWAAVLFEATFGLVMVVPALAAVYVPAGVGLHAGIYLVQRAPFFGYVWLYCVFVPWSRALGALRARARGRRPEVLFDEQCPLCVRAMTVVRYADWLDRLRYSEVGPRWASLAAERPELSLDACRHEMHVILPDGSVRRGFLAFRALLPYLPALWPLLPLSRAPGAARVGPRLYRLVAARRSRFGSCTFDGCAVGDRRGC